MFIQVLKPACRIQTESLGTTVTITMSGSADLTAVEALQTALEKAVAMRPRWLLYDLSQLEFISSLAVGSMIAAASRLQPFGGRSRIVNARPLVMDLMRVSRLSEVFEME